MEDITGLLKPCAAVALVGTCLPIDSDGPSISTMKNFQVIHWGRGAVSTGVSLLLHRSMFSARCLRHFWDHGNSKELKGRVAAVRVKSPTHDLCFLIGYGFQAPNNDAERRRNRIFFRWFSDVLDELPHRCIPIWMLDANAHVGLRKLQEARAVWTKIDSPALGDHQLMHTNSNGELLHQVAERHHMKLANTFFPAGHSFYHNSGNSVSTVDFVVVPQAIEVASTVVWRRTGDSLQLINCKSRRDHRPVVVELLLGLPYSKPEPTLHWDHDAVNRCLFVGERREELVGQVERALGNEMHQLQEHATKSYPDDLADRIWDIVHTAAKDIFQKDRKGHPPQNELDTARLRRFALRGQGIDGDDQGAVDELKVVTRQVRKLKRRQRKARCEAIIQELDTAWATRSSATAWRLTRALSDRAIGPKRRKLSAPQSPLFSSSELLEHYSKPGAEGGFTASRTDWRAWRESRTGGRVFISREARERARFVFRQTARKVFQAPLRKQPPSWTFPTGIWRALLFPNVVTGKTRHGLGFGGGNISNKNIYKAMNMLHCNIQATRETPLGWHMSHGFHIKKPNNKPGLAGQRALHSLDGYSKCFFAALWSRGTHTTSRPYACGYMKHRRREQAIAVVSIMRSRLRKNKRSHATDFLDLTSAFACPDHEQDLAPYAEQAFTDTADRAHLVQRLGYACSSFDTLEGDFATLKVGSGTLPGDSVERRMVPRPLS